VYGYPVDQAAAVALRAVASVLQAGSSVTLVRFVLFSERVETAYGDALAAIDAAPPGREPA
jgi:O-acetyl-ADP-ribose deacetylase (regulator of RNase III)